MKKTLAILFLGLAILCNAQTHRFYYDVEFRKDSLSEDTFKELFVLDIDKEETKFYANRYLVADSLMNLPNIGELIVSGAVVLHPHLKERLKRKTGSDENINYHSPGLSTYYFVKTKDVQKWKILPEKKGIQGFTVQKAITDFGGRQWEAWFSVDIPFSEGPHKFRGLPGMILELYDTKKNYVFSFVGKKTLNERVDTSFFLETDFGFRKPIEVNEKKWKEIQMQYFEAPFKETGGKMYKVVNGEMQEIDMREKVRQHQERMRKENNPIELNKAVKYPTKK